jgi:prevent-host-death family protein
MAMAAGIRELKDNLSEYVRRAEAGERIAVTAHGRVVAVLGPADARARGRRVSKLDQMIADGRARPALEDAGDLFDGWPIARLPKGTAAALIDADREED